MSQEWIFLDYNELKRVQKLRKEGNLDDAEKMLKMAEPSEAVLDELRKVFSQRANLAKKENDWQSVVDNLEKYTTYAKQWRSYCVKMVNAEPPKHSEKDEKLLQEAKNKLNPQ